MATGSSASRVDASVATTRASSREPNAGIKPMTFLKYSLLAVHPYPSSLITPRETSRRSGGTRCRCRKEATSSPPNREDSRIHTTSLSEWPLSKKNDESAPRARARGRLRKILGERVLFHERLARVAPLVSAVPRELQAEVEREFLSQSQDVAERGEVRDFVPLVANLRVLYHEQSESLGERIRPRAREAGGDRGEKDDVRIVPSPLQIGIHVRVRAQEHLLEREKRAFRAVPRPVRSRGGFEVRSR